MMFHESMMSEQVMNFQKTFEKDWTFLWLKEPKQRRLPIWVTSSVSSWSSRTRKPRGLANHGFLTLQCEMLAKRKSLIQWISQRTKASFLMGTFLQTSWPQAPTQVTPRRDSACLEHIMTCFFCRNAAFCGKPTERSVFSTHSFSKRKTYDLSMNFRCFPLPALKTRWSLWWICFKKNMERSLQGSSTWIFPHQNRGQDIRSAGCSVLRSPQPTPTQSQPVAASRRPPRHRLRLSLISTVTCLRWVQISLGVIGGDRIVADYWMNLRMDRWIRIPIHCWLLLIWGNEKSMFQCRATLLNIHRFAWSHSAQPCYFQNSQKKTWVQCHKIMSTFVLFSAQ